MSLLRKVRISEFSWFTPQPPKGGVLINKQIVKVPFRGFRGKFTFRSGLNNLLLKDLLFILFLFFALPWVSGQKKSKFQARTINSSVSPYLSLSQHNYDVKFYFIDLLISNTSAYLQGETSIKVESVTGKIDTLVFELHSSLNIDSVFVNSQLLTTLPLVNNLIKIVLPETLKHEPFLTARIMYHGEVSSGGFFSGVRTGKDFRYNKSVTFTISEPFQSMNWFPCKQDLTDKADSAWIYITVNNNLKAGSNGLLTALTPVGSDKTRYEWKTNYPVAYYLLSFSVSDYLDYTFYVDIPGTGHSMPVQNYLYNDTSILTNEKKNIDITKDLLLLYSEHLGIYPFFREKYGHCLAPLGGGMEHQTMTTLTNFNFALVAHELAHQWFGNYVTCKTWQDIWINEGFASYLEYFAIEKLGTSEQAEIWIESAQNSSKNNSEGSVFIDTSELFNVDRIFNLDLSYKKGALILHMLRYELDNDSLFFFILKNFLKENKFGAASGAEFLDFVNFSTNENYNWFFDQWYFGKGYPFFVTSWSQTEDSLILKSIQETSSSQTPFFRLHMDYKIKYMDGSEEIFRVNYLKNEERFAFPTTKLIESIVIDPENKILKTAVVMKDFNMNQSFEVTPNPFYNKLTVRFQNSNKSRIIRLNDLNGSLIFETNSNVELFDQDFSFLKPGIYILSVSDGNNDYSVKIIKTNRIGN